MASGWFVFAIVTCIVISCGFVLAVFLLKAAWTQRERESLSSSDLRALEESAVILIEQLKAEVDQGIAEIESRQTALDHLIREADARLSELRVLQVSLRGLDAGSGMSQSLPESRAREMLSMTSKSLDLTEITRDAGMDCAEVKLRMKLARLGRS